MKRTTSTIMAVILMLSTVGTVSGSAKTNYEQPFERGIDNSDTFRIPAIITLNDGSILAAADMRYSHGSDSPNNIDTLVATSPDGLNGWQYEEVNNFDDYADSTTDVKSASFIDSALVQSKKTNRIFILTDAFPSGIGYNQAKKGSGFIKGSDNKLHLALSASSPKKLKDYEYYVGDCINGYYPVYGKNGQTDYSVDSEYNLYKNGKALYMNQINSDTQINQNVFYSESEIHVYPTSYLWLRFSNDNGETWSTPSILNSTVKNEDEAFLGVGPGKGTTITVNGKERILFSVYDNKGLTEHTSTVYSDDNGVTWQRGEQIKFRIGLGKTSEAQIVTMPDNSLMMFARNASDFISYSKSTDGGVTWTRMKADKELSGNANCMVSFINYSKKVNGKDVVIGSFVSDISARADGIIKVGTVQDNEIEWISTYHVNSGFFAYSCLTELADGKIGYLYEDEAAHISYKVLVMSETGKISEINGKNAEYNDVNKGGLNKIKGFFQKVGFFFHIL